MFKKHLLFTYTFTPILSLTKDIKAFSKKLLPELNLSEVKSLKYLTFIPHFLVKKVQHQVAHGTTTNTNQSNPFTLNTQIIIQQQKHKHRSLIIYSNEFPLQNPKFQTT